MSPELTDADLDYLRNINTRPGPTAGRSIDPTQPGPTADRIAWLKQKITALEKSSLEHSSLEHYRAELSRLCNPELNERGEPMDAASIAALAQSDAQPDAERHLESYRNLAKRLAAENKQLKKELRLTSPFAESTTPPSLPEGAREALERMASQRLSKEKDQCEDWAADYKEGYDELVTNARDALRALASAPQEPAPSADAEGVVSEADNIVLSLRAVAEHEDLTGTSFDIVNEAAATIDALEKRIGELEAVIAWANNSLYGSHGFFLSTNGGPPNEHHLDEAIEKLKAHAGSEWRRAEAADQALTAERQRREECEAALRTILKADADFVASMGSHFEGDPLTDACAEARAYVSRYPSESDNRTKVAG